MGWIGVETNGGAALTAQWAAGSETLYVLGATVGSGYVADANMRIATALQDEKDNAAIAEAREIDGGIEMRVRVTAIDGEAYTAHEIGIWAKLGENGTRTLISLHQDAAVGISVPTVNETPEFAFDLFVILTVDNTGDLNVSISPSVYVTNRHWMQGREEDDRGLYFDGNGYLCQRISADMT